MSGSDAANDPPTEPEHTWLIAPPPPPPPPIGAPVPLAEAYLLRQPGTRCRRPARPRRRPAPSVARRRPPPQHRTRPR